MDMFSTGPSTVLFIRSVRLSTYVITQCTNLTICNRQKMEELHEILTNWVRKLDNSDVRDVSIFQKTLHNFINDKESTQRNVDHKRKD